MLSSRTPRGVRGLKYPHTSMTIHRNSRTPRGVRGLKSLLLHGGLVVVVSHPSRGAWIEIFVVTPLDKERFVAPLAGCVD